MGKRSEFARRPMDSYLTIDPNAITPLAPFLGGIERFAEPCVGEGHLVRWLEAAGLVCVWQSDIADKDPPIDALSLTAQDLEAADAIITNPPWTREILHRMIVHFQNIAPTWLLFDAAWPNTKQSAPYLDQCSHIVAVGRLRWIEGTPHKGKDDCCWYRFDARHVGGPRFIGWQLVAKHTQRAADTRKALKVRLTSLEGDKRALKAAYDHDLAFIVQNIAEAKETAQRHISADLDTAARARAFLK